MATRGVVGYIQEDGTFLGVYVHYDCYPSGVGSILLKMHSEDIRTMVTMGIMKGGIRAINSPLLDGVEYFNEDWPEAKRTELPGGEEYDYILDTDGTLTCTDSEGNDIPQDEWRR
jgi:hypothetical protein